ncbi:MBL fold metallo-hydrolase [Nonlabens antarcticus]|uniref:MBL fold metallo-hydrolase n=1 Tax=Nonlabens antarcticus TaxID=392714 RepID=UPI001891E641|nr:MBL fold metallo-hydrolase [Nonlabens antarcticus]
MDKIDIFSRLDELRTAVYGKPVKILPDTFLMKFEKNENREGNGYVMRHKNRQDIIIIDGIREEHRDELTRLKESGYNVKAVLLTNVDMLDKTYADLETIKEDLGADIYIHDLDNKGGAFKNITSNPEVFQDFGLKIIHTPGHTNGSVIIYCDFNKALFTGDSAVGSPYKEDDYYFDRPIIENDQKDLGLRESWRTITEEFEHILPLHGKPQFDLTDDERTTILRNLIKDESTKKL